MNGGRPYRRKSLLAAQPLKFYPHNLAARRRLERTQHTRDPKPTAQTRPPRGVSDGKRARVADIRLFGCVYVLHVLPPHREWGTVINTRDSKLLAYNLLGHSQFCFCPYSASVRERKQTIAFEIECARLPPENKIPTHLHCSVLPRPSRARSGDREWTCDCP